MASQTSFFENLFGFQLKRKPKDNEQIPSIIAPSNTDGALVVGAEGNHYGITIDIEGQVKTENELIRRYREIAKLQEVDSAIEDIVNESIVTDDEDYPVKLSLDLLQVPNNIKKKFQEEFIELLNLLDFNEKGHDIFRQWYVDGRLYAHILFEKDNTKEGIAEIRFIDPRKIKKIKQINRTRNPQGIEVISSVEEYYVYNEKGITENNVSGVKMSLDSIVLCGSGNIDGNTGMMVGNLDKAIKPANQLKMIEDSIVIYRITRAPERRVFYIDVGNLPKHKAEQYVSDMMNKFKNKLVYDAHTGEVADSKRHMSMMEDFWMPRREGGKGTEITTLPGGQGLNQLDDLEYFKKKLQLALNVPMSRTKEETGFTIGQSQTITRDEIKFAKFIGKLRMKFSSLFTDLLKIQLIAKGIIGLQDWKDIKIKIRYDYIQDNHFSELKDIEVLQMKLGALQLVDQYCGKYYSKAWIQRNVLHMDEEEIEDIANEIEEEGVAANPVIPGQPTVDAEGQPVDMMAMQQDQQAQAGMQQDQQMQNDQEAHDQAIEQKDQLHQEKLKKAKAKPNVTNRTK
jgi:Bacteriophage T4-like portal protein (Gp20)